MDNHIIYVCQMSYISQIVRVILGKVNEFIHFISVERLLIRAVACNFCFYHISKLFSSVRVRSASHCRHILIHKVPSHPCSSIRQKVVSAIGTFALDVRAFGIDPSLFHCFLIDKFIGIIHRVCCDCSGADYCHQYNELDANRNDGTQPFWSKRIIRKEAPEHEQDKATNPYSCWLVVVFNIVDFWIILVDWEKCG